MTREQAILNFIDELSPYQMHGFILSMNGERLYEGAYAPFSAHEAHRMYSVSKSCVSLAIGLLAGDGVIGLDDPITDHFPEWTDENTPALLKEVTIRNMLRMATCYDRAMYSPLGDSDWTKPFFRGQPTHVPGTVFTYDTSASQTMCALVERKTGREILAFLNERLFEKIGMTDEKRWLKDGCGTSQGGSGLLMSLSDFDRLAQFVMSDGQGLIDEEYLRAATSFQIATGERTAFEERFGYGYQFWMTRHGFSMYGMGGQMAVCVPEKKLSLVTTGDLITDGTVQPIYDAFFRHLADIDALPSDQRAAEELQARLRALRVPAREGRALQEKRIALAQGTLPMRALTVRPGEVSFEIGGKSYALPYACGEWREGVFPASDEKCISSGGWVSDSRFEMHVELKGDFSACMKLFIALNGERATVRVVSSLWEFQAGWSGQDWGKVV